MSSTVMGRIWHRTVCSSIWRPGILTCLPSGQFRPSEKRNRDKRTILFVKIGIAGLGFMGVMHLGAFSKLSDTEVAAISAESARSLSGDLSQVGGNIERPKTNYDLSSARKYADWRDL